MSDNIRCKARWPYEEPRDQCELDYNHKGPHETSHESHRIGIGKLKHKWPNADDIAAAEVVRKGFDNPEQTED